jgi:hypothetical protein
MKEDTIDYGVIMVAKSRKRGSALRIASEELAPIEGAQEQAISVPSQKRQRGKSMGQAKRRRIDHLEQEDFDAEDVEDEDEYGAMPPENAKSKGSIRAKGRRKDKGSFRASL